jgi:hypothetical protein
VSEDLVLTVPVVLAGRGKAIVTPPSGGSRTNGGPDLNRPKDPESPERPQEPRKLSIIRPARDYDNFFNVVPRVFKPSSTFIQGRSFTVDLGRQQHRP